VVGPGGASRYNPATGQWTAAPPPPQPSYFQAGALFPLRDGRVFATDDGIVGLFDPAGST
jgi:hypothetical protein